VLLIARNHRGFAGSRQLAAAWVKSPLGLARGIPFWSPTTASYAVVDSIFGFIAAAPVDRR
jgi:hypothetical protein